MTRSTTLLLASFAVVLAGAWASDVEATCRSSRSRYVSRSYSSSYRSCATPPRTVRVVRPYSSPTLPPAIRPVQSPGLPLGVAPASRPAPPTSAAPGGAIPQLPPQLGGNALPPGSPSPSAPTAGGPVAGQPAATNPTVGSSQRGGLQGGGSPAGNSTQIPALPQPLPPQSGTPSNGPASNDNGTDDGNPAEISALKALGGWAGETPAATSKPEVTTAPTTPAHVGDWSARLSNGSEVKLSLQADGSFRWQATNQSGAVSTFDGAYSVASGSLTLTRSNDQQKLSGSLTEATSEGFVFRLAGAKDDGIRFVRA